MSFEWISTATVLLLYYGVHEAGAKWDAQEHLRQTVEKEENVGMAILGVKPSLYLTRGQPGVLEKKPCSLFSHQA